MFLSGYSHSGIFLSQGLNLGFNIKFYILKAEKEETEQEKKEREDFLMDEEPKETETKADTKEDSDVFALCDESLLDI